MQGLWELIPELPSNSLLTSSSDSEEEKSSLSLVSWLLLVASGGNLAATESSSGSLSAPETHSGKNTPPGHKEWDWKQGLGILLTPRPSSLILGGSQIIHFNNTATAQQHPHPITGDLVPK